jgi:predicted RNA binding protein YcfA (HicA-like mRNA interferase family)
VHAKKNPRIDTRSGARGFVDRGGNGSHRNFVHPRVRRPLTLAGKANGDAKQYQEKAVKRAIEDSVL